jgi:hypothetical protein
VNRAKVREGEGARTMGPLLILAAAAAQPAAEQVAQ